MKENNGNNVGLLTRLMALKNLLKKMESLPLTLHYAKMAYQYQMSYMCLLRENCIMVGLKKGRHIK
jgi:hypothetical protein